MWRDNKLSPPLMCILLLGTLPFEPAIGAVTIETVPVGNPGNKGELCGESLGGIGADATVGAVAHEFRIGKYEVTNSQYVEFLNAVDPTGKNALGLYDELMSTNRNGGIDLEADSVDGAKYVAKSDCGNKPVVYVDPFDAFRFANWLHNGQGDGDTESGAYELRGGTPTPRNALSIKRNPNAKWFLPSEHEWYKAAYHKNDGVTGNYWDYPTSTDEVPYSDQPPGRDAPKPSNAANFFKDDSKANNYDDGVAVTALPNFKTQVNMLTNVGAYTKSVSPYGTFDQGGNVAEWTETVLHLKVADDGTRTGRWAARGGNWTHNATCMSAAYRGCGNPPGRGPGDRGFRLGCVKTLKAGDVQKD